MTTSDYRRILLDADEFFRRVIEEQPAQLSCGKGCSLCCHGLFEIGTGDVPIIAEGLALMHPMRRRKIIRRAMEILSRYEQPDLRECSIEEKEAFFERTQSVACPNLDDSGACLMYEHRPLVCRTFGLPLRDGDDYIGDICELNFTAASDAEKLSAAWNLQSEDILGQEDEFTIPEAIVLIARTRGWMPPD
jgi:Fe-S-cluster containining protein